jgi:predicted secreted protein
VAASLVATVLLVGCVTETVHPDASPAAFVVAPGQRFNIPLDSNPSTGYRWQLAKAPDESVVKLVGSAYQQANPGGGAPPRPGQAGFEVWTFEGVAPGRTSIELNYVRASDKGQVPASFALYSVEVR